MSRINNVVFIHGWGLNKAVWNNYLHAFSERFPALNVFNLDIPGYGDLASSDSDADLVGLAKSCLEQAPAQAVWVGWSLGGMIAMQAALLSQQAESKVDNAGDEQRAIQGLQLINTTPKFVYSDDWASGVDIEIFRKFSADLSRDYAKTLASFLLLQAGSGQGARQLARDAQNAISVFDKPTKATLTQGIECLANCDLRAQLTDLRIPSQVVCGKLDRVTKPSSSHALAELLASELVEIHSGHAPFLTHQTQMLDCFSTFLESLRLGVGECL